MSLRIGVDGGATKTEGILVDAAGRVIARHAGPGCNPNVVGAAPAGRIAAEVLEALKGHAGHPIEATLLCMAGAPEFWTAFAAGQTGFGRVAAATDAAPTLELAAPDGPGIVLHAGTGSFVAARTAGHLAHVHYAGGLGWRFGDEGSGYDIGRRAIARALLELQGWAPASGLSACVRAHTGLADHGAITSYFYQEAAPNARIAALAPALLDLVAAGDPVARALVLASADGLLALAAAVAATLFPAVPAREIRTGVSGPILSHPAVWPKLQERSVLPLRAVEGQPIEGVRRLVARL